MVAAVDSIPNPIAGSKPKGSVSSPPTLVSSMNPSAPFKAPHLHAMVRFDDKRQSSVESVLFSFAYLE